MTPQPDRKDAYHDRRQEERGQTDTDHGKNGYGIVDHAVLMSRRFDAERNGDYKLQNSGNKGDPEGNTHVVHDHLSDGFLIFE